MRWLLNHFRFHGSRGNVLVMGVMIISLMTVLGMAMLSRMVTDSHVSANKAIAMQSFYLADGGIQLGRRWLVNNSSATTIGPLTIGNGTVRVTVETTTDRIGSSSSTDVYRITSTGTVGTTSRQIIELRKRGNPNNKSFLLWMEAVADQDF